MDYLTASHAALLSLEQPARRLLSNAETLGELFTSQWAEAIAQAQLVVAALELYDALPVAPQTTRAQSDCMKNTRWQSCCCICRRRVRLEQNDESKFHEIGFGCTAALSERIIFVGDYAHGLCEAYAPPVEEKQ